MPKKKNLAARDLLERREELKNHSDQPLVPYEEFAKAGSTYYFTPGGFLYRKDPWSKEVGGFFCGYFTDNTAEQRRVGGWSC